MDQRIIDLYDEYTHAPLDRRVFLDRLTRLVGGTAAAFALLPVLENNYAHAAVVAEDDPRLVTTTSTFDGATGAVTFYEAKTKEAATTAPAVLVIHENRGLNPHTKDTARRLALDGFRAVAVDFLSPAGGTPSDEDKARDLIGKLDPATTLANATVAVAWLASAGAKVGAVGFCWGGGLVGRLATASDKLSAGVVYYGMPPESAEAAKIKAPLLLHYAGQDERINASVPAFEAALKQAGVTYDLFMYEGKQHAFNNDTNTARYDKEAADLAWGRTVTFFRKTLA